MKKKNNPGCKCCNPSCGSCNPPLPWQITLDDFIIEKDGSEIYRISGGSYLLEETQRDIFPQIPSESCRWTSPIINHVCPSPGAFDPDPIISAGVTWGLDFFGITIQIGWLLGLSTLIAGYTQTGNSGFPSACGTAMEFDVNYGLHPQTLIQFLAALNCAGTGNPDSYGIVESGNNLKIQLEPPP